MLSERYNLADNHPLIGMSTESFSLEDLIGHETDPADVRMGTEPEYFKFVFFRDDIGVVEHESYAAEVTPVGTADIRMVRELESDGWRFFAEIHTKNDRFGSGVTFLLEDEDGEIRDVLLETGAGVEFLHPVTIEPVE